MQQESCLFPSAEVMPEICDGLQSHIGQLLLRMEILQVHVGRLTENFVSPHLTEMLLAQVVQVVQFGAPQDVLLVDSVLFFLVEMEMVLGHLLQGRDYGQPNHFFGVQVVGKLQEY